MPYGLTLDFTIFYIFQIVLCDINATRSGRIDFNAKVILKNADMTDLKKVTNVQSI